MNWLKQSLFILALLVISIAAWARLDPGASTLLARTGLPDSLVTMAAGTPKAGQSEGGVRGGFGRGGGDGALVVASQVGTAAINDRISAIGDGEALRSVVVVPLSSGILEKVDVSASDRVEAGMQIAALDSEAELIARDQARLAVELARDKVERYERLVQSNAASTVQLSEARNELQNAHLTLRERELALERRSIVAPIAGTVDILPVEAGDYVTQQTEIATIDDRSHIFVDFYVPERFAAMVEAGQQVETETTAVPGRIFPGNIQVVAGRVDRASRTLQLRAIVDNSEDLLRPGMSFRVRMSFKGKPYPAVDPLAVQWSSNGPYLWQIVDGKAQRVGVRIIQRNSDYVLVDGGVTDGDTVVTEGLQSLRPGMQLNIARRTAAPTGSSTAGES